MTNSGINRHALSDDAALITAGWTLDDNNALEMVDTIMRAQAEGYRFIIIDMCDLEFLSSAGVGAILGTVETNRESGGDIILCNLNESVQHILVVLDLADYLTIEPDLDAAVTRCAAQS